MQVPGELVEREHAVRPQQLDDLVERDVEIADVVEREARDNRVVRLVVGGHLLELQPAEPLAVGGGRIDAEHVVAGDGERGGQGAGAAPDVEHPRRRRREQRAEELLEWGHWAPSERMRVMAAETTSKPVRVSLEEARRIAVRAQLLDGTATSIREHGAAASASCRSTRSRQSRRRSTSSSGAASAATTAAELDRLLWEERALFEWNAFIYPIEDLPLIQARMRRRRGKYAWERRSAEFLPRQPRASSGYVLNELAARGPLLSRELDDHSSGGWDSGGWYGNRNVSIMLDILHGRGEVAIVGRRGGQRLWGLASDWYPETEKVSLRDAERIIAERRFRARGVDLVKGEWHAHPEVVDGPVPDRATLLSPFDRLIYDRDRAEALWGFRYRLEMYVPKAKREYGYYVLPLVVGDQVVGRAEPRFDRKTGTLELLGAWGDTSRLDEALAELAAWLGAERIERVTGG